MSEQIFYNLIGGAIMEKACTKEKRGQEGLLRDEIQEDLMREITCILQRNRDPRFLRSILTRARNLEKVLNNR